MGLGSGSIFSTRVVGSSSGSDLYSVAAMSSVRAGLMTLEASLGMLTVVGSGFTFTCMERRVILRPIRDNILSEGLAIEVGDDTASGECGF